MNSLRVFTNAEVSKFGGSDAFSQATWHSGVLADGQVYGIPWTVDVRNIYYRRDLFEKAGIDESTAFQDIPSLQEAWRKLLDSGVEIPWITTIANTLSVLHYLASWVWGSGGHFISADGKRPRFNEPEAKSAIYHYFTDQLPYLVKEARNLGDTESSDLFRQGKAAAIFSGYWLLDNIQNSPDTAPVVRENLGIAKFPLPTYVGGSHLIVWKNYRSSNESIDLVHHLTSKEIQSTLPTIAQIPARKEALEDAFPISNSNYKAIIESLETGRTFTAPYLWGMVESRLLPVIVGIWDELYENPKMDLKTVINERLDSLATRLSISLSSCNTIIYHLYHHPLN